jgi:hypothetical protein
MMTHQDDSIGMGWTVAFNNILLIELKDTMNITMKTTMSAGVYHLDRWQSVFPEGHGVGREQQTLNERLRDGLVVRLRLAC